MTNADIAARTVLQSDESRCAVLDPADSLVFGNQIDRDLAVTDRGRRKLIAHGFLPPPDGYFRYRAFWRLSTYRQFKQDLFAGKFARHHRIVARNEVE